jgi:ArsR family metal-binding transcriptional regulator
MSQLILFEDEKALNRFMPVLEEAFEGLSLIEPPPFCQGLMSPCVVLPYWNRIDRERFNSLDIRTVGNIENRDFGREIPAHGAPDPRVFQAVGWTRLDYAANSVSDPYRLRLIFSPAKGLATLIPVMAGLISGGAYNPVVPSLAIEEGHRLIVITDRNIVLSRVDDILDAWIMLRTTADLITFANERYQELKPETKPRRGLGASEIYKRLPATDCGQCGKEGCMEFATELLMGKLNINECRPLQAEEMTRNLESLAWLLEILGPPD